MKTVAELDETLTNPGRAWLAVATTFQVQDGEF